MKLLSSGDLAATFSGSSASNLGGWRGVETVTGAADGLYQGGAPRGIYLVAEVAHVHVDDVGGGVEVVVPDGREDLLPGEDLPAVAHEVLEQGELPAGELYLLVFAPGVTREEVYPDVVGLYLRRFGLAGAAGQRADAREQLLEHEGLGQVVVCPRVEGANLVAGVLAGREHQHRKVGAPETDAPEHL